MIQLLRLSRFFIVAFVSLEVCFGRGLPFAREGFALSLSGEAVRTLVVVTRRAHDGLLGDRISGDAVRSFGAGSFAVDPRRRIRCTDLRRGPDHPS